MGNHFEPISDEVVDAILKTLEDDNDVVDVVICNEFYNDIFEKIRDMGNDNRKGIRVAPKKAVRIILRRNIFNYLKLICMTRPY